MCCPRIVRFLQAVVLAGVWGAEAQADAVYTLQDLGSGVAWDVNAAGQVVGETGSGAWHYDGATRSTLRFGAHFLDTPPDSLLFFTALSANAINNSGRITGCVVFIPQELSSRMAYIFDGGAVATLIGDGAGFGVNNAGSVVGAGVAGGPGFRFDGSRFNLAPGPSARLLGVNDASESAGSVAPTGVEEAAIFSGNSYAVLNLKPLGLPPLGPAEHHTSFGRSINNLGQVVGSVQLKSATGVSLREWGFLHGQGAVVRLGSLGGPSTSPRDINNGGVIVGTAPTEEGVPHAFIHAGGLIADLNAQVFGAYGWVLRSANAVNDDGLIVGEGTKDGVQRAFLLRPVANPLPPVINSQPSGVDVFAGDPFQLSVTASGTGPIAYRWQHEGKNVAGATDRTYSVANAKDTDAGTYQVAVKNAFGTSLSGEVVVRVTPKGTQVPSLNLAWYAGITVHGTVGQRVQIEAVESAGATDWRPLATVTLSTVPFLWVDPDTAARSRRFYRALLVP